MIYKFRKPINLFKGLLTSFTEYYNVMYIPKTPKEKYCYVHLTTQQQKKFLSHFGANGGCVIDKNSPEYPGTEINKLTRRNNKFIRLSRPKNAGKFDNTEEDQKLTLEYTRFRSQP